MADYTRNILTTDLLLPSGQLFQECHSHVPVHTQSHLWTAANHICLVVPLVNSPHKQNQHKQRVNRIFRGWIWREREWGCCWTELMGDLGVISLAWRPPLNKDQLSRTQYKSPGMGRAGGGRQWEEMGKDPWDIRRKWMSCIIKEVMSGCARDEGKEQESFHLFTNNLCLSPSMEIINADPRGPPHGAQHTAVCVWIHLSLYIHALARSPPLSRSLSVIHFLAGRVRVQWHVSGIDAAARW